MLVLVLLLSLISSTLSCSCSCDPFNTKRLYPSATSSREWHSKWDITRTLDAVEDDLVDGEATLRGSGEFIIDQGIGRMTDSPRYYVYDLEGEKKWENFEVTVYANREEDSNLKSFSGFTIFGRSNHDLYKTDGCQALGYYARIYFESAEASFQKEFFHGGSTVYSASDRVDMEYESIPKGKWFGIKWVVRTVAGNVELEMYLDETDGVNGGDWKLIHSKTDDGTWGATSSVPSSCGYSDTEVILRPGNVVALRTDSVISTAWKKMEIREIDPNGDISDDCLNPLCTCSTSTESSITMSSSSQGTTEASSSEEACEPSQPEICTSVQYKGDPGSEYYFEIEEFPGNPESVVVTCTEGYSFSCEKSSNPYYQCRPGSGGADVGPCNTPRFVSFDGVNCPLDEGSNIPLFECATSDQGDDTVQTSDREDDTLQNSEENPASSNSDTNDDSFIEDSSQLLGYLVLGLVPCLI